MTKFEIAQRLELQHWQAQPGCSLESHSLGSAAMLKRFGFEPNQFAGKLVLDVGCGPTGRLSALTGARIVGIDPLWHDYSQLAWCVNCYCSIYVRKAEDRIEELGGQADFVWCVNALDHVDSPQAVLKNTAFYLRRGGTLLLSVDCGHEGSGGEMHPTRMEGSSIQRLIEDAGLSLYRVEDGNCYRKDDGTPADAWGDSGLAFHWWCTRE